MSLEQTDLTRDESSEESDSRPSCRNYVEIDKYNLMSFALTNARSLLAKIPSLIEAFENLNLHFCTVSETWLKKTRSIDRDIGDLVNSNNLGIIKKNRGARGGGVAIVYDTNKISLKQAFPFPDGFEAVCGVGKSSLDAKKFFIVSFYLPPKSSADTVERFCDLLSDRVERAKNELKNPYIIIAGDQNKKNIDKFLRTHGDLRQLDLGATRGRAALDCCYVNMEERVYQTNICQPLHDTEGNPSDHALVGIDCRLKRVDDFTKIKTRGRHYTIEGQEQFGELLAKKRWISIVKDNATETVEEFNKVVEDFKDQCFPWREYTRKSGDKPWFTKRIGRLLRRKKRAFKYEGKTTRYHDLVAEADGEILENKERFFEKVRHTITGKPDPKAYFRAIKLLQDPEAPAPWSVRSLFPGKTDEYIAEEAAEYFSRISAEFDPIPRATPTPEGERMTVPSIAQIASKIRSMKKPKGQVKGDVDHRILSRFGHLLAVPLRFIFEQIYEDNVWPKQWNTETVTLIPKKGVPESLADLRNISCTPFFSKLLENFILDDLKRNVKLSDQQFGGKPGVGVDHLLIEAWDFIHRSLETPGAAVGMMAVDFHKAFNRMSHRACLDSLTRLGASRHSVDLINAFLHGRRMQVKVENVLSAPREVPGGAPQGSITGPFLFCATIDSLLQVRPRADLSAEPEVSDGGSSPSERSYILAPDLSQTVSSEEDNPSFFRFRNNPLDDSLISYIAPQARLDTFQGIPEHWRPAATIAKGYVDDITVFEKIRECDAVSHHTQQKTIKTIHAPESQAFFEDIEEESNDLGMKINPRKTQLLCVSASSNESEAYISHGERRIRSEKELKILGFWFGERPGVGLHVKKMVGKARTRLWGMRKLKFSGLNENDLLQTYKFIVRPILDYTVPTYHPQLTQEMSDEIEQLQASAMKVVFGNTVSYRTVIEHEKIEMHFTRREELVRRFALKNSNNPNFNSKWFPLNLDVQYNLRDRNLYLEEHARTTRLQKSPIFYMRRQLNTIENK